MIIKTRPSARANAHMKLLDDTVPTDREVLPEYCPKPYLLENQAKIVPKPLQAVLNAQCRQHVNNYLKSAFLSKIPALTGAWIALMYQSDIRPEPGNTHKKGNVAWLL